MPRLKLPHMLLAAATAAGVCSAQSIVGSVTAADTGDPLPGVVVVAFQQVAAKSQKPAIYKAFTTAAGQFTLAVSSGQYKLCVHEAGLYLDPCRWGGASTVPAGATNAAIRLAKGGRFNVRVHDTQQLLRVLESSPGAAVSVAVVGSSGAQILLPKLADYGRFRDYGAVLPLNVQMNLKVTTDQRVSATNEKAVPLSPGGAPFVVTPPPAVLAGSLHGALFHVPDATVFHVYMAQP